jgi:hypothetical protein
MGNNLTRGLILNEREKRRKERTNISHITPEDKEVVQEIFVMLKKTAESSSRTEREGLAISIFKRLMEPDGDLLLQHSREFKETAIRKALEFLPVQSVTGIAQSFLAKHHLCKIKTD